MAAPDLATVKAWCRIDDTRYDDLLPLLIADAAAQAGHQIAGDSAYYLTREMPASVQMWCGAQVAHWLESPSASVLPSGNTPQRNLFLDGLLDPYRLYGMETMS